MIIHFDRPQFGTSHAFSFHGGDAWFRVCQMCGATRHETLTPVDTFGDDGDAEERAESSGQTLCERCCKEPDIGGGWPGLTLEEMRALWASIPEKVRNPNRHDAARAVAAHLEDLRLTNLLEKSIGFNQALRRIAGAK